jgi:hypothetical protein
MFAVDQHRQLCYTNPAMQTLDAWAVSLTMLLAFTVPATAQGELPCPSLLKIGEQPDQRPNRANRQEFATDLLRRMQALHNAIPALSPSEQQWLQGELNGSMLRQNQALARAEGQEWIARNFTSHFVQLLGAVASGKVTNEPTEMTMWADLADNFGQREFGRAVAGLVSKGVLSRDFAPRGTEQEMEMLLNSVCHSSESAILERIVIPYLASLSSAK